MIPISFSTASGRSFSLKLRWWGSAALTREQDAVEVEALDGGDEHVGIGVAGDPEMADDALIAGLDKGLDGAAVGKALLDLLHLRQGVHLPEVDVVGLEQLEGALEELQRAVAGAVVALGGEDRPPTGGSS